MKSKKNINVEFSKRIIFKIVIAFYSINSFNTRFDCIWQSCDVYRLPTLPTRRVPRQQRVKLERPHGTHKLDIKTTATTMAPPLPPPQAQ